MRRLKDAFEFDWNKGNIGKNKVKHSVEDKEAEEAFFDTQKKIYIDKFHSEKEDRFILLGKTQKGRLLYIIYTKRKSKIRVISARDVSKQKDIKLYKL